MLVITISMQHVYVCKENHVLLKNTYLLML